MNKQKVKFRKSLALILPTIITLAFSADSTAKGFSPSDDGARAPKNPPVTDISAITSQWPGVDMGKENIEANSIIYNDKTKDIVAEGNAALIYKNTEMKADKLIYNQDTHLITANDGGEYIDSKGTIYKFKTMVVNDKFDKGQMTDVSAKMKDGESFRIENLTIVDVNKYNMKNVDYAPCKACADGRYLTACREGSYLFSLQAKEALYDGPAETITYHEAYFNVFGESVFYTPWLSSSTPSSQSKSGFLAPAAGWASTTYGYYIQIPYYWSIAPNMDYTFAPLFTTNDGPILINQYRHLLENGSYVVNFSLADPPKFNPGTDVPVAGGGNQFRGHIQTKGDFTLDNNWGWGFDASRVTDDTYLQRYKLGIYDDILTSRIYLDQFVDRDYFSIEALSFQDLRPSTSSSSTPDIAPLIQTGKTIQLDDNYNQKLTADLNAMSLQIGQGADSNRATGSINWNANYISNSGQIFKLDLTNRLDYYNVAAVPLNGSNYDGSVDRYIPTAALTWSYPLQKMGESYGLVMEPVTMAVVSSNGNNTRKIPNEDGQNSGLEEYNIFDATQVTGYDIVQDGSHVNYGMRGVLTSKDIGDYNFLLGQVYSTNIDDTAFSQQTGLTHTFSDYVGRVVGTNGKVFTPSWRFLIDNSDMHFVRNEVGAVVNLDPFSIASTYTFLDENPSEPFTQELAVTPTYKITDEWSIHFTATRNMDNDDNAGWIGLGGGINFVNDCFTTLLQVNRTYVNNADIVPTTTFQFKFVLKNFGS